jgi:hypothetical protein
MEIAKDLCSNELRKAAILITKASQLGMTLNSYGNIGVNQNNGNVYMWLEEYPFSLFIDLGDDTIQACWSSFESGCEEIIDVNSQTLYELEQWCENLYQNEIEEA